jgi:DNA (cytosine-5)-methyltransferase 1
MEEGQDPIAVETGLLKALPTMIDLYAGCGGVTQGFKNKGFKVLAAVEIDPITAETYRLNHPEVVLYEEDIREVKPEEMMERCDLDAGELAVLSVCAPCQPFSRQNRSEENDSKTRLVLEMIRFVEALKPQIAFMENVPGLGKGRNRKILDELIDGLSGLGYIVSSPQIVDAVSYGVPQFRKRLILLASRERLLLTVPAPTHASPDAAGRPGKAKWRTVGEVFVGLLELESGQKSKSDPLHKARLHTLTNLERIRHIPHNGGSRDSLPPHLQLACHKNGENVGYYDVYGRMDSRKPSNTLTTGCTNFTKGRFAHPIADRAITPREAARLQTFPDSYQFWGNYDQISAQIGNAVPVVLAEAFAGYFYELWKKNGSAG